MANIDWSKQNPNYPLWLEGKGEHAKHSGWYRRIGEVFEHETHGQFRAVREGQFFDVHVKPEWNGEGLPPVGLEIEFTYDVWGYWLKGKVLCYGQKMIFMEEDSSKGNGKFEGSMNPEGIKFRPIRTPEQIAEEERENAIAEMASIINKRIADIHAAEDLYDAGYRKQVTE